MRRSHLIAARLSVVAVILGVLAGCGLRPLDIELNDGQTVIKPNVGGLTYRDLDTFELGDETIIVRQHVISRGISIYLESVGRSADLANVETVEPIGAYELALGPIYALHAPTADCANHYALVVVERRRGGGAKILSMGCKTPLAFQPLRTKQVVAFEARDHDPIGRIVTSSGTSDSLPLSTWFDEPEAIVAAARARRGDIQ